MHLEDVSLPHAAMAAGRPSADARLLEQVRRADRNAGRRFVTWPAQIVASQGALSIVYSTTGPEGRVPLLTLRATGSSASVTANRVMRRDDAGGPPP